MTDLPRQPPSVLFAAVLEARAELARERHLPRHSTEPVARIALLAALEAYVGSLLARGHPVPYALRDELRLQRATSGPTTHDRLGQPPNGARR